MLLYRQHQRALAVVQRQALQFLRAILNARQLAQAHRGAIALSNHNVGELLRAGNACIDLHHAFLLQRADGTYRQVLVSLRTACTT